MAWDRYAGLGNNPVNRIDPTGHMDVCPDCGGGGDLTDEEKLQRIRTARLYQSLSNQYSNSEFTNLQLIYRAQQMSHCAFGDAICYGLISSYNLFPPLERVEILVWSIVRGLSGDLQGWADALIVISQNLADAPFVLLIGDIEPVIPYEVGLSSNLYSRSLVGDKLQIHHAPQGSPANQIISGYNYSNAPAIVLPYYEHLAVNRANTQGPYVDTTRNLMAKTIWDLRNYTNTPNSSLWKLLKLFTRTFPGALSK